MPEPKNWAFLSFVTDAGRDVAQDWDAEKTFEAEQAFRNMVRNSKKTTKHTNWTAWRHPMKLEAGKAGVVELGFKASGRPYRALCMFKGQKCIVLLCMCFHKGDVWTPPRAVQIATERAKIVAAGKANLNDIQIEDDI